MASLSVSTQTIVIFAPATNGSATLKWDAGPLGGAVWEKIDANTEAQFDPPTGLDNSNPGISFSLDVGQTAVFTLRDGSKAPLAPSVTVKAVLGSGPGPGAGLGDFATTVQNGLDQIYQIGNFRIVSGVTVTPGIT